MRSGYYSTYFLVPQKDSGHRPIRNLKFFNLNVCKTLFKMETLQSIIAIMRSHQWMASVDLKDAYFHVRVVAAQHQFLRFRWQGTSYPFGIFSCGLSSTPLIAWLRLQGVQLYAYFNNLLIIGESEAEVAQSIQKTFQVLIQPGFVREPEKVITSPHTGSCVHRGKVLDGPEETLPTRDMDPATDRLCKILFQSRGVQTRSPILEFAGADGSNAAVGEIRPPPHASHPVVPEAVVDPHNPQFLSSDLCQQRYHPHTSLVIGQVAPVSGNAVYVSQHHHHHNHYRCEHGGVGWPLYCARVRHSALQQPLDKE